MYTKAVGTKFHPDGTFRHFPGNTVISMCTDVEPLFSELVWAQEQFKALPFADRFAFLPPSSFHMTVFELLCDQVREPEYWSALVPRDAHITEADRILYEAWRKVEPPASIDMEFVRIGLGLGLTLNLRPKDEHVAAMLKEYRDALSRATGIRFPNHDTYRFHIGLAYNLRRLEPEQQDVFEATRRAVDEGLLERVRYFTLPAPQFVKFHDMSAFYPDLVREY